MLARRALTSVRASSRIITPGLRIAPVVTSIHYLNFSTTRACPRGPTKYKKKHTKLPADKRIRTPEELLQQASNVDVDNLRNEVQQRTQLRYVKPNKYWMNRILPGISLPEDFSYYDDTSNRNFIKHHLVKRFGAMSRDFVWKDLQYTEVTVGDVVDLSGSFEKSDLAVIVELPQTPDDPRYTLVNAYGELQFVSRSKMGLRIPKVFPKAWFNNCVMREDMFWEDLEYDEIVPIGKPKYKLEDVVDRNKIFESAISRSITSETAAKTYLVPSLLSGIVSEVLTNLITTAWQFLPDVNLKLEVLHNILQSNESPIQFTLYQLYSAVELTDLQMIAREFQSQKPDDINQSYKKVLENIATKLALGNQFDSISLGRSLKGAIDIDMKVPNDRFYAFVLSLRKNDQIYSHESFAKVSSYVLALPLNRNVKFNKLVKDFKNDPVKYTLLAAYLTGKIEGTDKKVNDDKYSGIIHHYFTFIDLLKLYCAGSIHNNVLESFVIKILRNLPAYRDLDITGSIVYDLLLNTGEISNSEGPVKWWDNSMIPNNGVSLKCDYEQLYYDSITKDSLSKYVDLTYDVHQGKRQAFEDDVIYCIDSENPLEIDDGVSIKKVGEDEFIVSTFVADPASYLNPDSLISKIAFERGLTLYLPDLSGTDAVSLLPIEFGQKIQLGYTDTETRALKVSFLYNMKDKKIKELDDKDVISFGIAKKFIKIDYNTVNKILIGSKDVEPLLEKKAHESGVPVEQIDKDLKTLSLISQQLNEKASISGRVSLFDQINVKKEIEGFSEGTEKQIQLTFKDTYNDDTIKSVMTEGARSEQLVSEIMVMSNNIAGTFFAKHNIPAIYRVQSPLEMSPAIEKFSKEITTKKNSTFKELTIYQEYLTKSTISPFAQKHMFLNIDHYATVTSPLRRYWDLVNHWQLHSFITQGKPRFTQEQINYMALQLKYKDELNDKVTSKVTGFYTFKALKFLQENDKKSKIKFKVIVAKKPSESGLVDVIMLDYGVRCTLETSWYALNEKKSNHDASGENVKNLEIGDIIGDAIIKDIDLLDGSIVLMSDTI